MNAIQKMLQASSDLNALEAATESYVELETILKNKSINHDDLIIMAIHAAVSHLLKSKRRHLVREDTLEPISLDTYDDLVRLRHLCSERFESSDIDSEIFDLLGLLDLSSISILKSNESSVVYEFDSTFK